MQDKAPSQPTDDQRVENESANEAPALESPDSDSSPIDPAAAVEAASEPEAPAAEEVEPAPAGDDAAGPDEVSAKVDAEPTADAESEGDAAAPAEGEVAASPAGDPAAAPKGETTVAPEGEAAAGTEGGATAKGKEKPAAKSAPRKRKAAANASTLYRAFRSQRAIEAKVEKVIKGGFELKVGPARGFCPHSQIDVDRVIDAENYVGKSFLFRVTQVRRGGADVVLSRRALLEAERMDEAKAVRATLIEGSLMLGRVAGLAAFGAFIDLGAGVSGLVHVSEVSHSRVTNAGDVLKVGDPVTVKILKLDDKRGRISLSIRQAQVDPWAEASEKFKPGGCYPGTVRRLADFGIFVELAPGVEGLAPASELPPSRAGWRESLEVGTEREWLVLSSDPRQRRISLTIPVEGVALDAADKIEVGAMLEGLVQRVERFGVFVWLAPGRVGLMPNVLTGTPPGTDLSRRFNVEDKVPVEVVEIGEDGRRIRLAAPGAKEKAAESRKPARRPRPERSRDRSRPEPRAPQASDDTASFGTSLADKLKAAFDRQQTPSS